MINGMKVRGVDPRNETMGIDDPGYRVYFWDEHMTSDEYEITQADVPDVLQWAEDHAEGREYSVYARLSGPATRDRGVTLVRLAGWDAAAPDEKRPTWASSLPR